MARQITVNGKIYNVGIQLDWVPRDNPLGVYATSEYGSVMVCVSPAGQIYSRHKEFGDYGDAHRFMMELLQDPSKFPELLA